MKVLVTGAGGFIGSHLAEYLLSLGHSVRAFVRYNSSSSSGWLDTSPLAGEMEIIRGDIRDFDSVKSAVSGAEAVFHLAALIGIPYSYVSPLAYIRTNMEGSYNVLQAARECDVRRVVHTSTSEIYGTAQSVPIDETHPVNPQSPYAASKSAADQLALSYYRSFALPVTVVRPFNTYGPRQSARAIIPTIANQLAFGQHVLRLGNLTPTRDLNFVEDTVRGFVQVGLCDAAVGEVCNLANGKEISVGDLAFAIASGMGVSPTIEQEDQRLRPEKSEVERLCGDASKAKRLCGWEPRVSLREGLDRTIQWVREHRDYFKADTYRV